MARNQTQAQADEQVIGLGVRVSQDGNDIVIRIDASKDHGPSASGKTRIVASSKGNVTLANGVTLGINAYRKQ